MSKVRSVITGALRKLSIVGAVGRRTPSDQEFADILPILLSMYRNLITSGMLGRLRDVVPRGDYVAGENQRVLRRYNELQEILLPDMVSWCGSCGYVGTLDAPTTNAPSVPSMDYGCRPYGYHDRSAPRRTVRDGAVVTYVDEFSGDILEAIYDGQRKLWFTLTDLALIDDFDEDDTNSVSELNDVLNLEAPLSHRDLNGLTCLLAMLIADDFSAEVTASMAQQANNFRLNLVSNYSTYKRDDQDCRI